MINKFVSNIRLFIQAIFLKVKGMTSFLAINDSRSRTEEDSAEHKLITELVQRILDTTAHEIIIVKSMAPGL